MKKYMCYLKAIVIIASVLSQTWAMEPLKGKKISTGSKKPSMRKLSVGSRDGSPSLSPRISPRKPHHTLILFDSLGLPLRRVDIGEVGNIALGSLESILTHFYIDMLIIMPSNRLTGEMDITSLERDDPELGKLLSKLGVVLKMPYSGGKERSKKPTETIFFEELAEFSDYLQNPEYHNKAIYGISNNSSMYTMLLCWSIPIIIDHIMKKGIDIFSHPIELVNSVINRAYKRIFTDLLFDSKASHYLSVDEDAIIQKLCYDVCIAKKPCWSTQLDQQGYC